MAERTFTRENLLNYLQSLMDDFMEEKEQFGMDDRTRGKMHGMIACKNMVECLIGEPVNLQKDGKVTVGF